MSRHLFDYTSDSETETDRTSVGDEGINIVASKKRKCDNGRASVVSLKNYREIWKYSKYTT